MNKQNNTPFAKLALATALISAPSMALAEKMVLEEVVVTAQKRTQNLQDVPISITAISSEELEISGVTDTDSIANLAPNLHIKEAEAGSVTFAIRGLSNNFATNSGFENAVGFYVDGVYQGKNFGTLFDLGDVERMEVLRGPQGTLYGRNTIGGAINIISARPSGEFGGTIMLGAGNNNLINTKLSIDTPTWGSANQGIGEIRARVSGFTRERDGFTDNVDQDFNNFGVQKGDFKRFGDIDRNGARLAVDWDLRDNLQMTYDYTQSDLSDTPRIFQILDTNAAVLGPAEAIYTPYIPSGDGAPSEGSSAADLYTKTKIKAHTGTLTWSINDSLTLKSISAIRSMENSAWIDMGGTDMVFYDVDRNTEMDQSSQEIQLIGTTESINYVLGLYYYVEDGTDLKVSKTPSQTTPGALNIWQQSAHPDNTNKAVFGQIDWTPSSLEELTLTAGLRRTWEDKKMDRYVSYGTPFEIPSKNAVDNNDMPEISFSNTSVMLSPSYAITDDITTYYKFSQGFRSGGYDGSTTDPTWIVTPFESEEVDAHEIGVKSRFLDGRMQLNAALFLNKYDNMQLTEFDGQQTHTLNASKADITGGEIELAFLITENLSGSFSYSMLDFEFSEWNYNNPAEGIIDKDVTDVGEINNAPENTANIALDYDFPSLGFGDLMFHINYNYQASAHAVALTAKGEAPNSEMDSRGVVDARLVLSGVETGAGDLQFSLWGKNLTDEGYVDNIIDLTALRVGMTANPRTYGLEASLAF